MNFLLGSRLFWMFLFSILLYMFCVCFFFFLMKLSHKSCCPLFLSVSETESHDFLHYMTMCTFLHMYE